MLFSCFQASIIVFAQAYPGELPSFNKGDILELGSYPQSKVEDENLLGELNSLELDWKSYNYLANNEFGDFGLYCDIEYEGNIYRAVRLTENRPDFTTSSTTSSTLASFLSSLLMNRIGLMPCSNDFFRTNLV